MDDRTEDEFRSLFTKEIDFNFNEPNINYSDPNVYQNNTSTLPTSTDLPLEFLFPDGVRDSLLPITEQKLYLQLTLEFRIILNRSNNYQEGVQKWNLILPERLQSYGLTLDTWRRISSTGDQDQKLQEQLNWLVQRIFSAKI